MKNIAVFSSFLLALLLFGCQKDEATLAEQPTIEATETINITPDNLGELNEIIQSRANCNCVITGFSTSPATVDVCGASDGTNFCLNTSPCVSSIAVNRMKSLALNTANTFTTETGAVIKVTNTSTSNINLTVNCGSGTDGAFLAPNGIAYFSIDGSCNVDACP